MCFQVQELAAQYEKKQKELKNMCFEEAQLKRVLGMKQDKESKQKLRRQKKKEIKEQHVQEMLGYSTARFIIHFFFSPMASCTDI